MTEKKISKTATHILCEATQMFAQNGFEGTIMDNLAEQAQVNKASIYYHFQDKANLYEQCMVRLFKQVIDKVIEAINEATGTKEKLTKLICTFAKQVADNPHMPAILMREFADGGMNIPVPAREQMQRIFVKLKEILIQGEKEKLFNPIDHFSAHIMIIGSVCFFVTSQPMRQSIKTDKPTDPELNEAIEGVASIIFNGLLK